MTDATQTDDRQARKRRKLARLVLFVLLTTPVDTIADMALWIGLVPPLFDLRPVRFGQARAAC